MDCCSDTADDSWFVLMFDWFSGYDYVAGRVVIGLFGKAVPKTAGTIIWFLKFLIMVLDYF